MALAHLAPLKVKCTDHRCEDNLHCFKFHSRKLREDQRGCCRECGADLVDWSRIHSQDLSDADHTFSALKQEFIRHHYWHKAIDDNARTKALHSGRAGLEEQMRKRLASSVGKEQPFRDGTQTPLEGDIRYYAQHATASCCRKCMEYWHGISQGRPLEVHEIDYLAELALRYIDERLPDLPQEATAVPRKPRAKK